MLDLAALRRTYSLQTLSEEDVLPDPFAQFRRWFREATDGQITEPNAMTLSTADKNGRPAARIVLLKEVDARGFVFYTNYESKKGQDMAENPQAALLFFWQELERQVRIEGLVERVDTATAQQYYQSRPLGSQIGAWASPQSRVIPNRVVLEEAVQHYTEQYKGAEVLPLPPHWGGYRIVPDVLEFWQGRENRLHDRIRYIQAADNVWQIERLAP